MNRPSTHALRWPPERFYWAVLDAPGVRSAGALPPGLLPLLEEHIPIPLDDLHAVAAPLDTARLLVCAAARKDLDDIEAGASALTPSRIPPEIADSADPSQLNLLVGDYEPRGVRRARLQAHALSAAMVLLCAGLVTLGLVRRAAHYDEVASIARATAATAATATLHDPSSHFALREMQTVRDNLKRAAGVAPPADAAPALAALLAAWPADVPSTPQTITATADELSVSVAVAGDPAAFLAAMEPPMGWTMDQPRLNAAGEVTRIVIRLRHARKEPS